MRQTRIAMIAAGLVIWLTAVTAAADGAMGAKLYFEDMVPSGTSTSITITSHRSAAFRVLLRVPTAGRANLFLLGKHAPKSGPLIQTSNISPTSSCQGAAGSFYCSASFEPLPKGKYTWRIAWVGTPMAPAHVELTVRW